MSREFARESEISSNDTSYPRIAVDQREHVEVPSGTWHDDPIKVAPYVPTPQEIVRVMLETAETSEKDTLMDLGCGDGRILFTAALDFKVRQAIGYEIDPELCRRVNEQAFKQGLNERVKAINGDLFEADLSEASIVILYLTTAGNERLRPKLEKETSPGTRIVSHDFTIRDWTAERVLTIDTEALNPHHIYVYRTPESFRKNDESRMRTILPRIFRRLLRLGHRPCE